MSEHNPYAPPQAPVDRIAAAPALWNPGVAAALSLLFSPVFGALVHMKNWNTLGEPRKAARARLWAIGSLAFLLATSFLAAAANDSRYFDLTGRLSGFALLAAWYFASAREQQAHVAARFGDAYPRRRWARPIVYALLCGMVYVVASVAVIYAASLINAG